MLWYQLAFIAIVSLALTQVDYADSQAAVTNCRGNFSLVGGKCLLVVNNWFNWFEAERKCRTLDAELISLQNQTQLQHINTWLNVTAPFVLEFWTSGNSLGEKGFYYYQGTGEPARFAPWASGQPRQADGDCLSLYGTYAVWQVDNYRLSVKNCTTWAPIICEQQTQKYNTSTRICLKPEAIETSQVLIN